jgi:adapter protein MecA 1/2
MKFERMSDNQIRITLVSQDFQSYDVTVADLLTDRSGKAKEFFETLMNIAREDFDFEMDGSPLIVEAMQTGGDLVLVVTKVDKDSEQGPGQSFVKNIKDHFNIHSISEETRDEDEEMSEIQDIPLQNAEPEKKVLPSYGVCKFQDMESIIKVAKLVENYYDSDNTLYKNPEDSSYYLMYTRNRNTEDEFSIFINQLREFGDDTNISYAFRFYVDEHYKVIIKDEALQTLAEM